MENYIRLRAGGMTALKVGYVLGISKASIARLERMHRATIVAQQVDHRRRTCLPNLKKLRAILRTYLRIVLAIKKIQSSGKNRRLSHEDLEKLPRVIEKRHALSNLHRDFQLSLIAYVRSRRGMCKLKISKRSAKILEAEGLLFHLNLYRNLSEISQERTPYSLYLSALLQYPEGEMLFHYHPDFQFPSEVNHGD